MIYNVNTKELGINDLLQLVEIVFGEGKEMLTKISSYFFFKLLFLIILYENIYL